MEQLALSGVINSVDECRVPGAAPALADGPLHHLTPTDAYLPRLAPSLPSPSPPFLLDPPTPVPPFPPHSTPFPLSLIPSSSFFPSISSTPHVPFLINSLHLSPSSPTNPPPSHIFLSSHSRFPLSLHSFYSLSSPPFSFPIHTTPTLPSRPSDLPLFFPQSHHNTSGSPPLLSYSLSTIPSFPPLLPRLSSSFFPPLTIFLPPSPLPW